MRPHAGSPGVGAQAIRLASPWRRIVSLVACGDPGGAVRVLRHGVAWRCRRLRKRLRPINGLTRSSGPVVNTPVVAAESIAAAEAALQSLWVPAPVSAVLPAYLTVGVVIPTYRDSQFLAAALQSLCGQTYPHWRGVVVDDASPEDVGKVVRPFQIADHRIELLRHAANGGLSAARNTGLRHLDSDLVMFLDADDLLVPGALEGAVASFKPLWHDAAIAGVHGQLIRVPEEADPAELEAWGGTFQRSLVDWIGYRGECPFSVHAVVVRRAVVDLAGGFDETMRGGAEDWDLWFRLLRHGYRFAANENLVGAYRLRQASMFRDRQPTHLAEAVKLFDAAEKWAELEDALVVGRGAAAPLSRARSAHERSRRAAGVIGMEITGTGSLEPLDGSAAFNLLDVAAMTELRTAEIVEAAVDGAARGLGLSRLIANELSLAGRDKLHRVGSAVAAAIYDRRSEEAAEPPTYDATSRRRPVDVLLAADSVADVHHLVAIAPQFALDGRVAAADLELIIGASGVTEGWREAGVSVVPYHQVIAGIAELAQLVVCAPLGPVTADLVRAARRAGVRCHVVAVAGRPDALPCNESATAGDLGTESPVAVERSVPEATRPEQRGRVTALRGWRGSGFPLRLPLEDGPLDGASVDRLATLRDRHVGQTAVIIGNGPSLNDTEVELLTDVATFGVNAIFLAAERLPKPITYYVVEDTSVFSENIEAIKAFDAEWKLFPAMYRPSFDETEIDDQTIFFRLNTGFYGRNTGTTCHPRFSLDPTQRLYSGQSVTVINLQLAHWMGFRRVVLIGMDFSYRIPDDAERDGVLITSRSDDPNHFHPDYFGAGKSWKDPQLDRVLVNYHLADEIYRATGREIVNATEGGKLDLFSRVPLREALAADG